MTRYWNPDEHEYCLEECRQLQNQSADGEKWEPQQARDGMWYAQSVLKIWKDTPGLQKAKRESEAWLEATPDYEAIGKAVYPFLVKRIKGAIRCYDENIGTNVHDICVESYVKDDLAEYMEDAAMETALAGQYGPLHELIP